MAYRGPRLLSNVRECVALLHTIYARRVRYLGTALLSLSLVLSISSLALTASILVSIGLIALRSDKGVVVALGRSYLEVDDPSGVDVDA